MIKGARIHRTLIQTRSIASSIPRTDHHPSIQHRSFISSAIMSSDIPSTMRAWQLKSKPSSIDKGLALNSSAPLPASATKLPPDSSLIKIHAASLNPYDHKLPETVPSFMMKYPLTPGHDVAGRIVSTNMSGIKEGQDVLAMLDGKLWYEFQYMS